MENVRIRLCIEEYTDFLKEANKPSRNIKRDIHIKNSMYYLSSTLDLNRMKLMNSSINLWKLSRIKYTNRNKFISRHTSVKPQSIKERVNTLQAIREKKSQTTNKGAKCLGCGMKAIRLYICENWKLKLTH